MGLFFIAAALAAGSRAFVAESVEERAICVLICMVCCVGQRMETLIDLASGSKEYLGAIGSTLHALHIKSLRGSDRTRLPENYRDSSIDRALRQQCNKAHRLQQEMGLIDASVPVPYPDSCQAEA